MKVTQSLILLILMALCKLLSGRTRDHGGQMHSWMLAHLEHGQSSNGTG